MVQRAAAVHAVKICRQGADGATVFEHACKLGLEVIVSKRRDAPYRHGQCREWLKVKNPTKNAEFSEELIQPKPGERWLLFTSA